MSVVTLLFLGVIAALAAFIATLVSRTWPTQPFVAWFVFGLLLLILPALLPLVIHP